jgi:hypothetical protein
MEQQKKNRRKKITERALNIHAILQVAIWMFLLSLLNQIWFNVYFLQQISFVQTYVLAQNLKN